VIALAEKLELLRTRVEYQGGILAFACALITLGLLSGRQFTKEDIAARTHEDRLALLTQVLPKSLYDNDPLHTAITISDSEFASKPVEVFLATQQGEYQAAIFQMSTIGYGGAINMIIAIDKAGKILGVRVISHTETPGLADKIDIRKGTWITSFDGKTLDEPNTQGWAVKKDGGQFDQFAGATITPRAIVGAVHKSLNFAQRQQDEFARNAREISHNPKLPGETHE
jgi:Na+-translocating ferredoxin:NAD+ oxidoreductase subunit G